MLKTPRASKKSPHHPHLPLKYSVFIHLTAPTAPSIYYYYNTNYPAKYIIRWIEKKKKKHLQE